MLAERHAPPGQVIDRMDALARQLEEHFMGEEEAGGFFDQTVAREPRFADRTGQLHDAHQELLDRARNLAVVARAEPRDAEWWERLGQACHQFTSDLMRHEHEENALIQEVYTEDIAAED
jgi:iron-sulfur cluster repair protein YtfE (RIC family)